MAGELRIMQERLVQRRRMRETQVPKALYGQGSRRIWAIYKISASRVVWFSIPSRDSFQEEVISRRVVQE